MKIHTLKKGNAQSIKQPVSQTMAERTGLEPATPGVTGQYSNRLNYRSEMVGAAGLEPATLAL